jgi:hypothetical protein
MKKLIVILIWLAFPVIVFSQGAIEKKSRLSDKIFFGGGLGLQFGTVTIVDVSPMVGYKPTNNWFIGVKGNYQYYNNNSIHESTQIYGGSLFTSYILFENVALYAEYEALNMETAYFDPYHTQSTNHRFWVHSPLVGGGFSQSLGERSKLLILVLWDLNNSYYSPYTNPIIRLTYLY